LVRFDGLRFFVFDRTNTPAFRDDSILALCPSRDGSLWIGTEGGRLLRFRKGKFEVFGPDQGLTNPFVRALYEDAVGTLWIGSDRGFFRLKDGRIDRLDGKNDIPVAAIRGFSGDRWGRVWVAADIGLLEVDHGEVHRFAPQMPLRAVHQAIDDRLWLLSPTGVQTVENGRLIPAPFGNMNPLTISEDREGGLWIGTEGQGLFRAGASGLASLQDSGWLPDNTVSAVFEDRESNLWVGTGDGLLRLSRISVETIGRSDGLADDDVTTVSESRSGGLWLVTITGQVYQYRQGRVIPFHFPETAQGKQYRLVYEDSKGAVWLGTGNEGIIRLTNGTATSFSTRDGLRSNMIRQFLEDRRGDLWIALGSGLSRWDGRRFQNYYLDDGLRYGSVRVMLEDHGGDLVVGTDGGLNRIHDGKIVADALFAQLDGERIWALHEDRGGSLWVGTRGGGLFRIANGKIVRITKRDGLLSNAIFQLLEDGGGRLWFSGPAGVFAVPLEELERVADGHPGPLEVLPYGTADGLESMQMNGGFGLPGCLDRQGNLWFPGVKGAVRLDPNHTRITHPSPVLIESITADEKPLPLTGSITIPPGRGKLRIDFTAASLLSPERIAFRYKLEGFDPEWSAPSGERFAHYTNLPPGQYRFLVTATNRMAPTERSEASLTFVWLPLFYRTPWFYGAVALAFALFAAAGLRIYANRTKARYAVLFAERTRLAREMHDTVIQGCVGISTLLEAASSLQDIAADRTRSLLEQARIQARMTLDEARQAIWDLRQTHLESDISGTLLNFAHQLSSEKGVPIDVRLTGDPQPVGERTLRGILLVAREAIRNAASHAAPSHIRIGLTFQSSEALLEVVDDGHGFVPARDPEEYNGHYGILGMKERVEQLGGSFVLESSPGAGTTVLARLPLNHLDTRQ
jgi:ligand-binding sensor domain-containing protein/signal transduction histidine kinase